MSARILFLDIEATNLSANFGTVLCFGYMWGEDKKAKVLSVKDYPGYQKDPTNDKALLRDVKKLLEAADVWCGWYSSGYDIKFLQTRLLFQGLGVLPNTPHVDLWWWAKHRLKLNSNRLASVSEFFGLGEKTGVNGRYWIRAMAGHRPSLLWIEQHCKVDVEVLKKAYQLMRPLVKTHPNTTGEHLGKTVICKVCGSLKLNKRGFMLCREGQKQRYQCLGCGAWRV